MELYTGERPSVLGILGRFVRKGVFGILSQGPVPNHVAFILDGNRRFAKKNKLNHGDGYKAGFVSLISVLTYCYELGVKQATIYAFSIDNFRRRPDEVRAVMNLMLEKVEGMLKEESVINAYGVGIRFVGNLKLLSEPLKIAVDKVMRATAKNSRFLLFICVAYTSTDEMAHAVQEACEDKLKSREPSTNGIEPHHQELQLPNGTGNSVNLIEKMKSYSRIKVADIERNTYINVDPDIMIRTSGEKRLSNYLLWQASTCILYAPGALWPEIGLRHLVWSVIDFQRYHSYLENEKKNW